LVALHCGDVSFVKILKLQFWYMVAPFGSGHRNAIIPSLFTSLLSVLI
jgi:hypothetical protein